MIISSFLFIVYACMFVKYDDFSLPHFQGSLELLLCLIQKQELNIYDISIQELMQQFILKYQQEEEKKIDRGAEFIGGAASLLWLKSLKLLPYEQAKETVAPAIEDPPFQVIHHLIDYCRFKEAGRELALRQEQQQAYYFRGVDLPEWKKPLGIHHLSLEELAQLFKQMMAQTVFPVTIAKEEWQVADKIRLIREGIKEERSFPFLSLFSSEQTRAEMIVIFLAILELMKMGEIGIGTQQGSETLKIFSKA